MQKRWLKTTILYCGQENQKKSKKCLGDVKNKNFKFCFFNIYFKNIKNDLWIFKVKCDDLRNNSNFKNNKY